MSDTWGVFLLSSPAAGVAYPTLPGLCFLARGRCAKQKLYSFLLTAVSHTHRVRGRRRQHQAGRKNGTTSQQRTNMDMSLLSLTEMWNKALLAMQDVEPTEALLALAAGYVVFKLVHLVVTSPSIPKSVWVPLEPGERERPALPLLGVEQHFATSYCCY